MLQIPALILVPSSSETPDLVHQDPYEKYNIGQVGYCAKVPEHFNYLYTFSVFKGLFESCMVLNGVVW